VEARPAGLPRTTAVTYCSCCSPSPRLKTWLAFREAVAVIQECRGIYYATFHPHQYCGLGRRPSSREGGMAHTCDASVGSRVGGVECAHAAAASDRNVQVQRARGPACRSAAGWMSFRAALAVNSSSRLISWIDRQIAGVLRPASTALLTWSLPRSKCQAVPSRFSKNGGPLSCHVYYWPDRTLCMQLRRCLQLAQAHYCLRL
jgi:hypothetical protein